MNYSYVSILTSDNYVYGIALLLESLRLVGAQYPLHVLITKNISAAVIEYLHQLGVTIQLVDDIPITKNIFIHNEKINKSLALTWKNCWTKFKIFDLTQFDKIVFFDADIMVLKNVDHLFARSHMTAAQDGEYFGLWPDNPHFNSGCLVIEPNHELFKKILNFANNYQIDEKIVDYVFADQELLNQYYNNWPNQKELHLNKYYNIFPPYLQELDKEDIIENGYFLHFVGRKPWTFWVRNNPNETYSEYFYDLGKKYVEACNKRLDWQAIQNKLVITVYAICKNERNNVERWLNSFSKADYVCILDTGSTDSTWEYLQEKAKKLPNLIIAQEIIKPWRFDRARNESMKLIPKETDIFFMADLDEEVRELDWPARVRFAWDPLFSRGMYDYHRDLDSSGNIIRTIKEFRLHSKEWTHWENIVHEAICKDNGEKRFYIESCNPVDIQVWHYAKHQETNYAQLCEEELKECPDDFVMHLQLAIEYEILENYDKAAEHYEYILLRENDLQNFEIARCYAGLGLHAYKNNNIKDAEQLYTAGRLTCDFFADNYMQPMEMYYALGQYNKVIELGKLALQRCIEAQWCSAYDIKNYYVYYVMGLAYWELNESFKSLGYIYHAYKLNPEEEIGVTLNNYAVYTAQKIFRKEDCGL